ncbi:hypothetical protein FA13DRAFT_1737034 [Coprinellus micaceus]|uniref:Uncharacterized protein n=1 Tax=Coprinellus micaceus TaxID=71717 RepID=A0A4Y7SY95_COPMI|nr:hypothetical protein FA13DRAFT_1737034 [Coprinellus micaceus]
MGIFSYHLLSAGAFISVGLGYMNELIWQFSPKTVVDANYTASSLSIIFPDHASAFETAFTCCRR